MMCSIEGCTGPVAVKSRGWCNKHYIRWRRHGDPNYRTPRVIESECSIEGCSRGQYARTWCTLHYDRWFRQGAPETTLRKMCTDIRERFDSFVTIIETNDCIEWPETARDAGGYGYFTFENARRRPHRLSHEWHVGPIPEGHVIRHKCDNPPCVNPRHLETGTLGDNNRDRSERGRSARGERGSNAKLKDAEVIEIRENQGIVPGAVLADRYGVSRATISSIFNRRNWSHL